VLETARGGIVRRGLGYDWSDVGVLTNIGPDHIGQDGIETVEDIVHIKSLVAERVRRGGTLVLNADDEHLARLTERRRVREPEKKVVYFSLDGSNPLVANHLETGGTAYYLKDGWIVEATGNVAHLFIRVNDIPVTMNGSAEFQVANLMAAAAAARAYGLSRGQFASAMKTFASGSDNPGRANLYEVNGGYVMIDYGHNPDAFMAVCRMAAGWKGRRVTGVVGVPGDRDDSIIEQAGRVAARGFGRVIVKEDEDTRGRERGEVARLLCKAVNEESPGVECHIVLDDIEALRSELERLRAGDTVVFFYDKLEPALKLLEEFGAEQATTMREPNFGGAEQTTQAVTAIGA
jgi:cyanophycin synthetase